MEKSTKINVMNVRVKLQDKQRENTEKLTQHLIELANVKDKDFIREKELNTDIKVLEENNKTLAWVLDELLIEILQKSE